MQNTVFNMLWLPWFISGVISLGFYMYITTRFQYQKPTTRLLFQLGMFLVMVLVAVVLGALFGTGLVLLAGVFQ